MSNQIQVEVGQNLLRRVFEDNLDADRKPAVEDFIPRPVDSGKLSTSISNLITIREFMKDGKPGMLPSEFEYDEELLANEVKAYKDPSKRNMAHAYVDFTDLEDIREIRRRAELLQKDAVIVTE